MRRFDGHTGPLRCLAYSPDGLTLASGGDDGAVLVWDLAAGEQRGTLHHRGSVRSLAFSSDGAFLASGSWDGTIRLWDAKRLTSRRIIEAHPGGVYAVAFLPGSLALASGGGPGDIRFLPNAAAKEPGELHSRAHPCPVHALAFSPDGQTLASGGRSPVVLLWAVEEGRKLKPRGEVQTQCGWLLRLAFAPDSGTLAAAREGGIDLWDMTSGTHRCLEGHDGIVCGLGFAPEGETLLSAGFDETVRVWDVAAGRERAVYNWGLGRATCGAFAPDGMTAAAGGLDGGIVLWDVD
jgi:WD40 repeat protein